MVSLQNTFLELSQMNIEINPSKKFCLMLVAVSWFLYSQEIQPIFHILKYIFNIKFSCAKTSNFVPSLERNWTAQCVSLSTNECIIKQLLLYKT